MKSAYSQALARRKSRRLYYSAFHRFSPVNHQKSRPGGLAVSACDVGEFVIVKQSGRRKRDVVAANLENSGLQALQHTGPSKGSMRDRAKMAPSFLFGPPIRVLGVVHRVWRA
jgi:hypothetical protein